MLAGFGASLIGLATPWPRRERAARKAMATLAELPERLRDSSGEDGFAVAAEAIASGATRESLLGAIFLAGVEDIRPRPHGILHAVMMAPSVALLARRSAAEPGRSREAWHPVLFNLDDLVRSQERDRAAGGGYRMEPLAPAPVASAAVARRDLLAALDDHDPERAERAVVALRPHVDADALFEFLRPYTARCRAFLGHKVIHAVAVERMVRSIGWEHTEPALPETWAEGTYAVGRVEELLGELRTADASAATAAVDAALRDGASAAVVWDAIVLLGSEVFQRRPGRRSVDGRAALLPVHALTVQNALRNSYHATRADPTKRLLLFQATAWAAALRQELDGMVGLAPATERLEATEDDAPGSVGEVLASGSPGARPTASSRATPAGRASYWRPCATPSRGAVASTTSTSMPPPSTKRPGACMPPSAPASWRRPSTTSRTGPTRRRSSFAEPRRCSIRPVRRRTPDRLAGASRGLGPARPGQRAAPLSSGTVPGPGAGPGCRAWRGHAPGSGARARR